MAYKKQPRYRTTDKAINELIDEIVERVGKDANSDLIGELLVSSVELGLFDTDRGDLKIANATLKEMRRAFQTFTPYRAARKVAIFGSARTQPYDPLYDQARELGSELAANNWMVITGAGPGIMSAGIEGAGSDMSFGVSIQLPFEASTSSFIEDDPKLISFRYFFTRKLAFIKESHAFALLPGGFGTMDEAFELLTLIQTGKAYPSPIVLLDVPGGTYWEGWKEFVEKNLFDGGYVSPEDMHLVKITTSVDEAVQEIVDFYSNYHSMRFVSGLLVLRMQTAPDDAVLDHLSEKYGDIIVKDKLRRMEPTKPELADDDTIQLDRVGFRFDRHHWARLRQLIDEFNFHEKIQPAE